MARKKEPAQNQISFNFFIGQQQPAGLQGGTQENLSDFEFRFRQCLKEVLDDCAKRPADPLDRIEVAARMSRLLGREIPKTRLDEWTAMATPQRRMHVDALKAFCEVTGDQRTLHMFVASCGLKALTPDEALCAEYGSKMLMKRMVEADIKNTLSTADEQRIYSALLKRLSGGAE